MQSIGSMQIVFQEWLDRYLASDSNTRDVMMALTFPHKDRTPGPVVVKCEQCGSLHVFQVPMMQALLKDNIGFLWGRCPACRDMEEPCPCPVCRGESSLEDAIGNPSGVVGLRIVSRND